MDQKGRPFCNCTDPLFDGEFCDHYICADYCENGGFCSYTMQENKPTSSIISPPLRKCSCRDGFEGEKCEIQSTNCVSKCSSNHSTCTLDIDGRAICHCHPGYQGERCEQCAYDQVCKNGGHCIKDHDYGQFRCKCPPGKKEQNFTKKPHFFKCTKIDLFFTKKISFSPPGFIGPWCHSHLCDHVKCQNGGTCIPTPHGAQCQCPPDFKGPFCQDYACKGYCQHGGTPNGQLQSSGHYQCNCDCPPGTSGLHCEKDSCSTLQCFHGGHCTILGGREICNCTLGKKMN